MVTIFKSRWSLKGCYIHWFELFSNILKENDLSISEHDENVHVFDYFYDLLMNT